jgi:uncharacterized protein (DUF1501 family)
MATAQKDPVLVVVQLSGGNDYLNTVIPYQDPNYYDNRPTLHFPEEQVHKLDDKLAFNPSMGPMKEIFDRGDMAVVHGVGWENATRSHFRAMDIWHTAEPDKVGTEGWLGRAIRELDPQGENPVTAVNVGYGLPRALVAPGVSVASVADLSTYGLLTAIEQKQQRDQMLQRFASMYAPAIGSGPVMDYLGQTGLDALKGADMLRTAPDSYSSGVEYASNPLGDKLKDVSKILLAGLGTRIFYTEHGGFDTHAAQGPNHPKLWDQVSTAVADFWDDLHEHDAADNVMMFIFSEFGRRVKENGSGTDHGAAGVSFAIGPQVAGGMYSSYPETRAEALTDGDLAPNLDFRGLYTTVLEDWMGVDATPIVNGRFEKPAFIARG